MEKALIWDPHQQWPALKRKTTCRIDGFFPAKFQHCSAGRTRYRMCFNEISVIEYQGLKRQRVQGTMRNDDKGICSGELIPERRDQFMTKFVQDFPGIFQESSAMPLIIGGSKLEFGKLKGEAFHQSQHFWQRGGQ